MKRGSLGGSLGGYWVRASDGMEEVKTTTEILSFAQNDVCGGMGDMGGRSVLKRVPKRLDGCR